MIKVVVADDEAKVCQLICGLIDWASLDMEIVGVAHNGIEALDMIPAMLPDLMITDIRMPGYDGLEMISRAKKIKDDIDFIIVSGYRHFEYAQSAIKYGVCDYLLKPIKKEALLETLQKMRERYRQRTQQLSSQEQLKILLQSDISKLRSNLFANLLLQKGENKQEFEIEKLNEEYHFHLQPGYFQAFIVKIDCDYDILYQNSLDMLQEKAKQILRGFLKEKCFDLEISFQASRAYCILNYSKERRDLIRRQLKAAFDDLLIQNSIFENMKLTVGLGCAVENLSRLEDSLKSAEWAVLQRLVDGTGKLLEPAEIESNFTCSGNLIGELHRDMESAVEILDTNMASQIIETLKKQLKNSSDITGQEVFQLVTNTYSGFLMQLGNHQLLSGDIETKNEEFIKRADLCSCTAQLFDLLGRVIGDSIKSIRQDKKQEVKKPIRIAKQYMQQNYSKPISLDEVSGVVGFNASYFSSLFKKESGQNFTEYLCEVRMNKAKELLKETTLSVAKICEQVGYADLKHFTQGFKKFTGLKPNEFRKLYS